MCLDPYPIYEIPYAIKDLEFLYGIRAKVLKFLHGIRTKVLKFQVLHGIRAEDIKALHDNISLSVY